MIKQLNSFIDNEESLKKISIWSIVIGLAITIIYVITLMWNGFLNPSKQLAPDVIGQVGDFIGGTVGAIWTLASVLLLISTLNMQRKEMNQQAFDRTVDRVSRLCESINRQIGLLHVKNGNHELIGLKVVFYISLFQNGYQSLNPYQKQSTLETMYEIYHNGILRQLLLQLNNTNTYLISKVTSSRIEKAEIRELQRIYMNLMPFDQLEQIVSNLTCYLSENYISDFHGLGKSSEFSKMGKEEEQRVREYFNRINKSFLDIRSLSISN